MTAAPDDSAATLKSVTTRDLGFYEVDSSAIDDNARKLLINYSGIPKEKVGPHVDAIVRRSILLERPLC